MKNETKNLIGSAMIGAVLIPVIHYEKHEHILEPDYTKGNMIQIMSGYGDTSVSASAFSSVVATSPTDSLI